MTAQEPLDALVNLAISYIVISVAASAAVELVSQLLRVRGRVLGGTIRGLLGNHTRDFYALPTIRGLKQTGSIRTWLPVFLVGQGSAEVKKNLRDKLPDKLTQSAADHSVDFIDAATFAYAYATLDATDRLPSDLQGNDSPFRYQGGQLQLDQVRAWFEQAMRATTRQYRRSAQLALFLLGYWVAATIELDSAETLMRAFNPKVEQAALPRDWVGYGMTAAAVALGAQYWFDVVGKLLGLRSNAVAAGVWGRAARKP
ncbi:MAG: hypothetical protein OEZ65_12340 [Gemmatimonadota bacterium]|nr:hypothetical protein [Gemmatimonadota bacterium]MDH5760369.1 hypothetical protein [Gemmatimonadota bacterium]